MDRHLVASRNFRDRLKAPQEAEERLNVISVHEELAAARLITVKMISMVLIWVHHWAGAAPPPLGEQKNQYHKLALLGTRLKLALVAQLFLCVKYCVCTATVYFVP